MAKILLVEDDFALAMGTEYALQAEGYEVLHAANLGEARKILSGKEYADIILLDVMLPDGNGYDLCKWIREQGIDTPVIFLTAVSEEANVVLGLELGADDYIAKPYRVKELLARINVQLRKKKAQEQIYARTQGGKSGNAGSVSQASDSGKQSKDGTRGSDKDEFCFGSHRLVEREFRLYCREEKVEVTPGEFRLLCELIKHEGMVLTRNQLLERLYDTGDSFVDDNTLSVYMKRLRDKLGEDASYIETVRGVGYRFTKR